MLSGRAVAVDPWLDVTVNISASRWQTYSDGVITVFDRWGDIARDGKIGGTHQLETLDAR